MKHQRPNDFEQLMVVNGEISSTEGLESIIEKMQSNITECEKRCRSKVVKGNLFGGIGLKGLRQQVLAVFGRLYEESVIQATSAKVIAAAERCARGNATMSDVCKVLRSQEQVMYRLRHKRSLIGCLPAIDLEDTDYGLAGLVAFMEEDIDEKYEDSDDDMYDDSEDEHELSEEDDKDSSGTTDSYGTGSSQEGAAEAGHGTRESSISAGSFISSDAELVDNSIAPKPKETAKAKEGGCPATAPATGVPSTGAPAPEETGGPIASGGKCQSMSDVEASLVAKAEKHKSEYNKNIDTYNKLSGGPAVSVDSNKSKSEVNGKDEDSVEGDK